MYPLYVDMEFGELGFGGSSATHWRGQSEFINIIA
jgi:hypothetical protein